MSPSMHARRFWYLGASLLLAALVARTLWAAPQSVPTEQLAEPNYEVRDLEWFDSARARPVPARLYWPTAATIENPVPLVVFSHGMGGSREGYSYLGKHWSERGVASLHVQHVGSDSALWRGNPFGLIGRLHAAAEQAEVLARAMDIRFALDRMLSDGSGFPSAMLDHQRLVAAGHSYGATTTLLTAGAQVVRDERTINCLDPRFSAAFLLSAPPFYGEEDLAAVMRNISIPTLHITSTDDVIVIPGYLSGVADRLAVFDAITDQRKRIAVFRGGSHSMFTDRTMTGGPSLNAQVKIATADLTLAYLDLVFDENVTALERWSSTWHPILERAPGLDAAPRIRLPVTHSGPPTSACEPASARTKAS